MPRHATGGSFKKGDARIWRGGSASKESVAEGKVISKQLRALGREEVEVTLPDGTKTKMTRQEAWLRKVWDLAMGGSPWASELVAERTEGKVATDMNVTANGKTVVEFRFATTSELPALMDGDDDRALETEDVIEIKAKDVSEDVDA